MERRKILSDGILRFHVVSQRQNLLEGSTQALSNLPFEELSPEALVLFWDFQQECTVLSCPACFDNWR